MKAFHNDPQIKQKYLDRVLAHQKADEIIQGVYWEDGKGCAVGCTLHSSDHKSYETELGIPRVLARIEDRLFEGMKKSDAKEWPYQFLKAIPVGADLSLVWPKFAVWMLIDPEHGVVRFNKDRSIFKVAELYSRVVTGDVVLINEWVKARRAVYAVAANAAAAANAVAAVTAAAAAAAYHTAADADADAYADAANAVAYAANAKEEHFKIMADKLLEILREQSV